MVALSVSILGLFFRTPPQIPACPQRIREHLFLPLLQLDSLTTALNLMVPRVCIRDQVVMWPTPVALLPLCPRSLSLPQSLPKRTICALQSQEDRIQVRLALLPLLLLLRHLHQSARSGPREDWVTMTERISVSMRARTRMLVKKTLPRSGTLRGAPSAKSWRIDSCTWISPPPLTTLTQDTGNAFWHIIFWYDY